jgi:uncharacterized phage protein (TIGR02220 family)
MAKQKKEKHGFIFSPQAWLSDLNVMAMSYQEQGMYLKLLCVQWINGELPNDPSKILKSLDPNGFLKIEDIEQVLERFSDNEKGGLVNLRLEAERENLETWRDGKIQAGKKGAESRWGNVPPPVIPAKKPDPIKNPAKESVKKIKEEKNATAKEILDYLNLKAGKKFMPTNTNLGFINARLKEGYDKSRALQAIDCKVADWQGDTKMDIYLRPSTLFNASKFEGYANQSKPSPAKREGYSGPMYDAGPVVKATRPPPSPELKTLWDKSLEKIKYGINSESYDIWFSPIYPKSIEDNILTIAVPDSFHRKCFIDNYRILIEESVNYFNDGDNYIVEFCIENLQLEG